MTWVDPVESWAVGEKPGSSKLNQEIRDRFNALDQHTHDGSAGDGADISEFFDIFGDGSDGALNVTSGTTTLTAAGGHKNYTSVTVANGATLVIQGVIVRCQGTFDNEGTVHNDGGDASGSTGGVTPAASSPLRAGGNGWGSPTSQGRGYDSDQTLRVVLDVAFSKAGGDATTSAFPTNTSDAHPGLPTMDADGYPVGGAGGSGGANGSGGGAGGAGGGPMDIRARRFTGAGTFRSAGGDGSPAGTNGNGGGGGGGGHIRAIGFEFSDDLTWTCPAGAGGGIGSGIAAGGSGHAGVVELIDLSDAAA